MSHAATDSEITTDANQRWLHPLVRLEGYKFGREDSCARIAEKYGFSRQYIHRYQLPRPRPEMDSDGYPTEETLRVIREWPIKSNYAVKDLCAYCREAWNWGKTMWGHKCGRDEFGKPWITVSTGGWSGNEDIVVALRENVIFWAMCWLESRRGGHYKFITAPISETNS